MKSDRTPTSVTNRILAIALTALGLAIGAMGIHLGEIDDAPGAALLGILVMIAMVVFAVRLARRRR